MLHRVEQNVVDINGLNIGATKFYGLDQALAEIDFNTAERVALEIAKQDKL